MSVNIASDPEYVPVASYNGFDATRTATVRPSRWTIRASRRCPRPA